MTTHILGISAYYHDSAAAIVRDGAIVAAAQEERFVRKKNYSGFPHRAIAFCLTKAGIELADVDHVVFYEDPHTKFHRLLTSFHFTAPFSLTSFCAAMPSWLLEKVWLESVIASEMEWSKPIHFCDHHVSHGASAFFPSPFDEAAILTIDGVGEWSTTTLGRGNGNRIELLEHIRYPHSLGLLYSAFTSYLGFRINNGEYKVMGLAPYGTPRFVNLIKNELLHLCADGSYLVNQEYFNYTLSLSMLSSRFEDLFGQKSRRPESRLSQFHADIAASLQLVLNEAVLALAQQCKKVTSAKRLVLAGGVALNCVANGLLRREQIFEELWIQPAAGDAGGALGSALWFWHQVLDKERNPGMADSMQYCFLGPNIPDSSEEDDKNLREMGGIWEVLEEGLLAQRVVEKIVAGKVIAVARGEMEWGPRALGNRSIFADARNEKMLDTLNAKVKKREHFRPFAPMVLEDKASDWFCCSGKSPYMLFVHEVAHDKRIERKEGLLGDLSAIDEVRSQIPAVTHVNYTARLQTVGQERPFAKKILDELNEAVDCPVMVNTSFNRRGEPIVCSAIDAYRTFASTDIDYLVVGNRFFDRSHQMFQLVDTFNEREHSSPYLDELALRTRAKKIDRTALFGLVMTTLMTIYMAAHAIFSLSQSVTFWSIGTICSLVLWFLILFVPSLFIPILDGLLYLPSQLARFIFSALLTLVYFLVLTPIGLIARNRSDNFFDKWKNSEISSSWENKSKDEQKLDYSINDLSSSALHKYFRPLAFFVRNRAYFALPTLFILLLIGLLFFFVENSVVAPLIYPIF